jgi:SAM-dependent methyltransferase
MTKLAILQLARQLHRALRDLSTDRRIDPGPSYQTFAHHVATLTPHVLEKQIRFICRIAASLKPGSVLEVGSGYGLNVVVLRQLGFKRVVGIEIIPGIHHDASLLLERMADEVETEGASVVLGDAEATPFSAGEFSNVLAIEVLSHVPSLDRFLREANHILERGGLLVAIDGNNVDSPARRKQLLRLWRELREEDLGRRVAVVERDFPNVSPRLRSSIVLHTELLSIDDMKRAIPEIVASGRLPMNLYVEGTAPTFADSGLWGERGFSPPKLAKDLGAYGFDASSRIYLGSARSMPLRYVEDFINRLPLNMKYMLHPTFTLSAKKTADAPPLTPTRSANQARVPM